LIGHSGAGKSSCLLSLALPRQSADMDCVLGTERPPPLLKALDWLALDPTPPAIVVVSNHEQMLYDMRAAKLAGRYPERFAAIHFVYLRKPKEQLRVHLTLPTAGGRPRDYDCQRYTLDAYERFHDLFCLLANSTIDCSARSIESVAAEVGSYRNIVFSSELH
jgi:hypothetical protein